MNTSASFEILSPDTVRTIYRGTYNRFRQEAVSFYQEHSPYTSLPNTPLVIKELTNAIIFCNRFNVNVKNTLTTLLNCPTIETFKKEISTLKKSVKECNTDLKNIQAVGVNQRTDMLTCLPSLFQKSRRIYIKTPLMHSESQLVSDTLNWLNSCLPESEKLTLQRVLKEVEQTGYNGSPKKQQMYHYFLLQKKQAFKIGHVLKSTQEQLTALYQTLKTAPQETQTAFISFLQKSSDYTTDVKNNFPSFRKAHDLAPCRLDSHLFYQLKKINAVAPPELFTQMESLQKEYTSHFNQLHEIQIKPRQAYDSQDGIDMIVFSSRPCDIVTMSTFTDWENCMTALTGEKYYDIYKQIGSGSIIAYGVNSQNPTKKLARILLKPFITTQTVTEKAKISDTLYKEAYKLPPLDKNNPSYQIPPWRRLIQKLHQIEKGEIAMEESLHPLIEAFSSPVICNPDRIYIASALYGVQTPAFSQIVSAFAQEHLNKKGVYGTFVPPCKIYMDGLKNSYEIEKPHTPKLPMLTSTPPAKELTLFYQNKLATYFFQTEKDNITR